MNYRRYILYFIFISLCFFSPLSLTYESDTGKEVLKLSGLFVKADDSLSDITGLSMKLPEDVLAGTYLRVIDIIRNQGRLSTGPFLIRYMLEGSDGNQPGIFLGEISIQSLVRGGQKMINTTFPVPPDVRAGDYKVRRFIKDNNIQGESGDAVDAGSYLSGGEGLIHVTGIEEGGIRGYSEDPVYSQESGTLFTRTILINSNEQYQAETKILYYLSQSGIISDDLIFIGDSDNFFIRPKSEITVENSLSISDDIQDGNYFLVFSSLPVEIIDEDSPVYWISGDPVSIIRPLTDNRPTIPAGDKIPASPEPDVMTVRTDYPNILYIGEGNKITDSVTNIGGSTAGIVRVEYLLSSDDTGFDAKHLDWWTIHNLKAGETRTSQLTIGVPGGTHAGIYYLTKKITVTSSPPEINTANNFWTGNRPVRVEYNPSARIPDLAHVRTKFPCAGPGEDVEIADTITNIGNACAGQVTVAYYLSPYSSFDPSTARYLGSWEISSICVGEQLSNTIVVTVPADLINGEYHWFSVIDPCTFMPYCGAEMPELDKSNNINSGRLYIGPCVFCGC